MIVPVGMVETKVAAEPAYERQFEGEKLTGIDGRLAYRFVKRAFDIVFSAVILVAFCWLFAVIAIIVKIDDPNGPVFFRQDRVGINGKIFKMHPIHGFAADLNSAVVIFSATMLHLPVSTTHVVSGSIMGVGAAQRAKAVHWNVARQMITAWVMTIPCTAIMGAISYYIISHIMVVVLPGL